MGSVNVAFLDSSLDLKGKVIYLSIVSPALWVPLISACISHIQSLVGLEPM
jgi:hypothetical protein